MIYSHVRVATLSTVVLGGALALAGGLLALRLPPGPWILGTLISILLVGLFLMWNHVLFTRPHRDTEPRPVAAVPPQRRDGSGDGAELRARQLAQANAGLRKEITERRRVEETLEQERKLLHALMDHIPDSIYFKDRDSRFLRINRALADRFGLCDPVEAVGKSDADFFSAEHADAALLDEQEVLRTGQPLVGKEEKETWSDGRERWVLTTKMPLRDSAGKIVGTFGISRDITKRKIMEMEVRASEARTRRVLDTAYDAFVAMDSDGRIADWNRQAEITFGWSRNEAVGRTLAETIIPPTYREAHSRGLRQYLVTGEGPVLNRRIEVTALHRDGHEFPVELTIAPIRLNQTYLFGSFVRDITERKRVEAEVQRAREAAEAANRAKSEFLAVMSHEIRTPMNGIIGMTELALDTPLSTEQREYLQMVKASADALLAVINDILDFSKIEADKLRLETIDFGLRDTLGDTMKALALRAGQKGLELAYHIASDVPDALVGDPGRLRQVIINLVGNAIKFTEKGEVVVSVQRMPMEQLDGGNTADLQFSVKDTGIGIPAEKQKHIFNAFAQADSSITRKYGGTGLGLAISARLIELMGGRIEVESAVGRGSTFRFTARFDLSQTPTAAPVRPAQLARVQRLPVLVVDDNATNRRIFDEILSQWGLQPRSVDSGPTALAELERAAAGGEPFSLILLDAHMPEMDGFTLASQIRQRPELADPTVLMLTSAGHPGDVTRCRELGIDAYLMKPVKQSELLDTILKALGNAWHPEERSSHPPLLCGASATPARGRSLRVLLAEDSPINQKLAVRLLEKQGHRVVVANNGREALELLGVGSEEEPRTAGEQGSRGAGEEEKTTIAAASRDNLLSSVPLLPCSPADFDVVLMDVHMPELDGMDATASIRQQEQTTGRHIPIVAMTAHAMKGDRERCLAAGMDGYVSKPIRPEELYAAIAAAAPFQGAEGVLDRAEVLNRVGGDVGLLRELARLLLDSCPQRLSELREALAHQDLQSLQCLCHSFKGELGTFGARTAFEAAVQAEQVARAGDVAAVPEACAALDQAVQHLMPALAALVAEGTGP